MQQDTRKRNAKAEEKLGESSQEKQNLSNLKDSKSSLKSPVLKVNSK
jgi:hypothetical protein